jgi:alkaline phosphatase D
LHLAADLRPLPNDPASPVAASEFVATSISSRGGSLASMQHMQRHNPDIAHARGDERGWTLIEVTPEAAQCEFRATAHPALADAVFDAQARFAVEAGRPGVQAA